MAKNNRKRRSTSTKSIKSPRKNQRSSKNKSSGRKDTKSKKKSGITFLNQIDNNDVQSLESKILLNFSLTHFSIPTFHSQTAKKLNIHQSKSFDESQPSTLHYQQTTSRNSHGSKNDLKIQCEFEHSLNELMAQKDRRIKLEYLCINSVPLTDELKETNFNDESPLYKEIKPIIQQNSKPNTDLKNFSTNVVLSKKCVETNSLNDDMEIPEKNSQKNINVKNNIVNGSNSNEYSNNYNKYKTNSNHGLNNDEERVNKNYNEDLNHLNNNNLNKKNMYSKNTIEQNSAKNDWKQNLEKSQNFKNLKSPSAAAMLPKIEKMSQPIYHNRLFDQSLNFDSTFSKNFKIQPSSHKASPIMQSPLHQTLPFPKESKDYRKKKSLLKKPISFVPSIYSTPLPSSRQKQDAQSNISQTKSNSSMIKVLSHGSNIQQPLVSKSESSFAKFSPPGTNSSIKNLTLVNKVKSTENMSNQNFLPEKLCSLISPPSSDKKTVSNKNNTNSDSSSSSFSPNNNQFNNSSILENMSTPLNTEKTMSISQNSKFWHEKSFLIRFLVNETQCLDVDCEFQFESCYEKPVLKIVEVFLDNYLIWKKNGNQKISLPSSLINLESSPTTSTSTAFIKTSSPKTIVFASKLNGIKSSNSPSGTTRNKITSKETFTSSKSRSNLSSDLIAPEFSKLPGKRK